MSDPLKNIRIASPCPTAWEAMAGDERVRFCSLCSLNVYNFAEMTAAEIQQLLLRTEGRVCGRIYRRADGTMITRDCPTGLRALRKRISRAAAAAIAAIFSLSVFAADGKTCVKQGAAIKLDTQWAAGSQKAIFSGDVAANGDPLPGVEVVVRNEQTNAEVKTTTDAKGTFTVTGLDDGLYRVSMNLESLRPAMIEHLELKSSQVTRAHVGMEIARMGEIITVPYYDQNSQPLATTFTRDLIDKLPL